MGLDRHASIALLRFIGLAFPAPVRPSAIFMSLHVGPLHWWLGIRGLCQLIVAVAHDGDVR